MEKSFHDAAVEYLTSYTKSFIALEEGKSFYLKATEKYTVPKGTLYVGYKHEDDTVTVAWGNPQNRFIMHGGPAVLLPDSTTGIDLLCLYKQDDCGGGDHIYGVQSVESYGSRYVI